MKIRKVYWDDDTGLAIAVEGYDMVEFCFDLLDVPNEATLKAKLQERIEAYEHTLQPSPIPISPPNISFYENLVGKELKG